MNFRFIQKFQKKRNLKIVFLKNFCIKPASFDKTLHKFFDLYCINFASLYKCGKICGYLTSKEKFLRFRLGPQSKFGGLELMIGLALSLSLSLSVCVNTFRKSRSSLGIHLKGIPLENSMPRLHGSSASKSERQFFRDRVVQRCTARLTHG